MKRSVPIIRKTDVLLVGGSLAGCQKAVALKKQGLAVYAVTPYSAWGDDRWATLDLPAGYTPAQLKAELDRAFIDVGIDYLFETAPVRISRDAAGRINGVLLATRSGFAFVACRLVIDATYAYTVSALAGAAMPDRSVTTRVFGTASLKKSTWRGRWRRATPPRQPQSGFSRPTPVRRRPCSAHSPEHSIPYV